MYGQVLKPPPGITKGIFGGEDLEELLLSPSSTVINFDDLQIFRIGSGTCSFPFHQTQLVEDVHP